MSRLEQLLRGIKVVGSQRGRGKPRLPITPQILRRLRKEWLDTDKPSFDSVMLWAACSLCFFGFFRSGELTSPSDHCFDPDVHLSFRDVAVDNRDHPTSVKVHLKSSKTDRKTGNDLCPVSAFVHYLSRRGDADGPLFHYSDGRFLSRENLVADIRGALSKSGLDASKYSGHSFRSGAAIQMLGRWKSDAYKRYIKTPREQLAAFSARLAKQ